MENVVDKQEKSDSFWRLKRNTRSLLQSSGAGLLRRQIGDEAVPVTLWEQNPSRRADPSVAISEAIRSGSPFCAARLGNDEFETLQKWRHMSITGVPRAISELLAVGDPFFSRFRSRWRAEASGLKPLSRATIERFFDVMTNAFTQVDLLGSWVRGENYYSNFFRHANFCRLPALEPYRSERPWTSALAGKRVLVIHPFDETIERQFSNHRTEIFPDLNVLPDFQLITYRPPRSHFGEIHGADHWFELLSQMINSTAKLEFDVAIIGAGPFGLPLAAALKMHGRVAVHLGGATQILFGINGRRWEGDTSLDSFRNESWTRPNEKETPSIKQRRRSPYW